MGTHDEIARVAYELYEQGGRVDGKDAENWFEAEKIVLARVTGRAKSNEGKKAQAAKPQQKQSAGAKAKTVGI